MFVRVNDLETEVNQNKYFRVLRVKLSGEMKCKLATGSTLEKQTEETAPSGITTKTAYLYHNALQFLSHESAGCAR